ncbi:MAG TPA: CapA family protein, partial [Roseiflexaceae bacterium]|nr:CapA family protein [Roseiflexaceae bacterium]
HIFGGVVYSLQSPASRSGGRMGQARRKLARRAAALLLAAIALALPATVGQAAPRFQRGDGLDQPLLGANMCGAGNPGDVHFTFAATGDTFPHENIQYVAEAQGYDYLFDHVRPFLKVADLAYTNFDGAMLEGSSYSGYPAFNYNPRLAGALKNAGVGLVSTANNHIMDRGPEGLDATLRVLQQAGIAQHGTVESAAAAQPRPVYLPLTLTRGNTSVKLAFLSFSWGTNGIPDPFNQVNLLWQSSEYGTQGGIRQEVLDAIAQARREADLVIVAAHWGYEYQFYPDASQVEGARQMAAAGADLILGAQAHTLQPVDLLVNNGRRTLVIYSLANFLASQGAFQAETYSATSVILYVGITRHADGSASISGYRYLPTIHVDGDTRPAPIPAQGMEDVIAHVRLEMRDPGGARQISPEPPAGPIEICPSLRLPGDPSQPLELSSFRVGGDFAQLYATLGGTAPRPLADALAVYGLPLGPAMQELAGDCQTTTSVLYTERQRLELHPDQDWPYRVSGTQLGALAYQRKYGSEPQRRTSLQGDAIADARFRAFFETYGGLPVFGYPISPALEEAADGQPKLVQYFERARFELAPAGAGQPEQVRLANLGREYPGIAAQCPGQPTSVPQTSDAPAASPASDQPSLLAAPAAVRDQPTAAAVAPAGRAWWFWPLAGLVGLLLVGTGAWGLQIRADLRRRQTRAARAMRRQWAAEPREPLPAAPARQPAPTIDDEELLRRLLEHE